MGNISIVVDEYIDGLITGKKTLALFACWRYNCGMEQRYNCGMEQRYNCGEGITGSLYEKIPLPEGQVSSQRNMPGYYYRI